MESPLSHDSHRDGQRGCEETVVYVKKQRRRAWGKGLERTGDSQAGAAAPVLRRWAGEVRRLPAEAKEMRRGVSGKGILGQSSHSRKWARGIDFFVLVVDLEGS